MNYNIVILILVFLVGVGYWGGMRVIGQDRRVDWLAFASKGTSQSTGHFTVKANTGEGIILEWDKVRILSNAYREIMKKLSDIIVRAYVPIELAFLRQQPEVVQSIDFFKPFANALQGGVRDSNWGVIEFIMEEELKKIVKQDQRDLYDESDIALFVVAKDISGKPIGFVQFIICSDYPYGTVKIERMAIVPEQKRRGIGKFLISSIFTILPVVDRIYLYTRPSNEDALNAYLSYGFYKSRGVASDPLVMQGFVKLEYRANTSDILKRASQQLN